MITRIRDIAAAALDAAMRPSAHPSITADPVDAHAAEVTEQLGLSPRWAFDGHQLRYDSPVRYGQAAAVLSARELVENALVRDDLEDTVTVQTDAILTALHASGRLVEPGEDTPAIIAELRRQLRERNRQYGRASQTIGELRGDLARERERERTADQLRAVAARLSPDTAARSMIAEALGLPTDSTTGAIVVAIRGLREAAENPSVVEVDADQVSLPVAAAVQSRELIDKNAVAAEVLRRDSERLRAENDALGRDVWRLAQDLETERKGRAHLARSVEAFADGVPHGPTGRALRDLVVKTSGPGASGPGRDETGSHARGPVSIPWTAEDRQALAKALCSSEGAHASWDSLAGTGERQSYLAQARWLLEDGWRHLDAIANAGYGPAPAADQPADSGLPLSELFDNRDPQQDEARSTPTDGGEPQ